jgi:hypothetical protein
MHRQIINATPDQEVHHNNRNTLDNRRDNLLTISAKDHAFVHAMLRLAHYSAEGHFGHIALLAEQGLAHLNPRLPTTS